MAAKARLTSLSLTYTRNVRARLTSLSISRVIDGGPPIAGAGGDMTLGAAERGVLLGADAAGPGGASIVTREWVQLSKSVGTPTIVLSSTTVASPTFTAPILSVDGVYVFGYRVKDSNSLWSVQDQVTVTVEQAEHRVALSDGTWVPAGLLIPMSDGTWI